MSIYSHRKVIVLGVLAIALLSLMFAVKTAYVAAPYLEGKSIGFHYTVQGESNGSLYVTVSPLSDDAQGRAKYREESRRYVQAVAARPKDVGTIPVQVTFVRPLSMKEVQTFASEIGLRISSVGAVGHSSLDGKRGTYVEFSDASEPLPAAIDMDATGKTGEKLELVGVMVVQGQLEGHGLIQLLTDDRVYLADITELEIRELLAAQHADLVKGKTLNVSVPSPYWGLDW